MITPTLKQIAEVYKYLVLTIIAACLVIIVCNQLSSKSPNHVQDVRVLGGDVNVTGNVDVSGTVDVNSVYDTVEVRGSVMTY